MLLPLPSATALTDLTVRSARKSAFASDDFPVIEVIAIDFKVETSLGLTDLAIFPRTIAASEAALRYPLDIAVA